MPKSLIIIPTYNERENIQKLIKEILNLEEEFHILVIDDNSPDGTGKVVEELANKYLRIKVIHRKKKMGLASAYIAGFKYALKKNYDLIFEMDADLSHRPQALLEFLEKTKEYDLIIGSRYLHGVRILNWPFRRLLLSKLATQYVKLITGLPLTDATSGFKCFKRKVLENINLDKIYSEGYSFQIEMNFRVWKKGYKMIEIPIVFVERKIGTTKISKRIILEAIFIVWKFRLMNFLKKL